MDKLLLEYIPRGEICSYIWIQTFWIFIWKFQKSIFLFDLHTWCKTVFLKASAITIHVFYWMYYCKTSKIKCTSVGNKIVGHSDIVGASPVGAAPTISLFSTQHLASMDCTKTTARWDEKHEVLRIGAPYVRGLIVFSVGRLPVPESKPMFAYDYAGDDAMK